MEGTVTLAVILAALAATLFSGWKSGRPRKDSLNASWISWPLLTVLAGAVLVMAVVHGINLMGIETGQRMGGLSP